MDDYIAGEISAGRMSGPFPREKVELILGGSVHVSPLIVAIQPQEPGAPDKVRVCRHLSKDSKLAPSVNSHIEKEAFPTRFDSSLRVADFVSVAPAGTQASTVDFEKFHRTVAALPSHKPWLVVQGSTDGEFFIDHCVPFGCSSASSNAGMVANAGVDICHAEGVGPALKYEDDLKFLRVPTPDGHIHEGGYSYSYGPEDVRRVLDGLGFPVHKEKGDGVFRTKVDFIGFTWDIEKKEVGLPEKKRLKFLRRVTDFQDMLRSDRRCTRLDVEKIHGSLCHVAFVHFDGRSYLPAFSNFTSDFGSRHLYAKLHPPSAVVASLNWWAEKLAEQPRVRSIRNRGPPVDHRLFVDASTSWGIGVWIGEEWAALCLYDDWKIVGRDICWLETVAIEILIMLLDERGLRDQHILIHSDNQGTIGSVAKGRSRNPYINQSVRRTFNIAMCSGLTPTLVYVESALNPADSLSRGIAGPRAKKIKTGVRLPPELATAMFFL